ncbi:MAG: phosphotransferase [Nanobdellota archaeon]
MSTNDSFQNNSSDLSTRSVMLNKIKQSSLVSTPTITFLGGGYAHYNYLVTEHNNKYVFRIKHNKEQQFKDSLYKEYVFLTFFQNQNITFTPKTIEYNSRCDYMVESYLSGTPLSQRDFTDKQIDRFAYQLYQLFSLSIDKFKLFCKERGFSQFNPNNPLDLLQKYGFKRFDDIDKTIVGEDVYQWIAVNLKKNKNFILEQEPAREYGFSWGDIQSTVILGDDGTMYFYDFEHASISTSPGLAYIKIHGAFTSNQFNYLVKRYAYHSKQPVKTLFEHISQDECIIRVNDVIWSARKWSQTKKEIYKKQTLKRMELAKSLFD